LRGDEQGLADCRQRLQAIEAASARTHAAPPRAEIDLSDALADMGGDT
jgi:hypothetical protein